MSNAPHGCRRESLGESSENITFSFKGNLFSVPRKNSDVFMPPACLLPAACALPALRLLVEAGSACASPAPAKAPITWRRRRLPAAPFARSLALLLCLCHKLYGRLRPCRGWPRRLPSASRCPGGGQPAAPVPRPGRFLPEKQPARRQTPDETISCFPFALTPQSISVCQLPVIPNACHPEAKPKNPFS